MDNHKLAALLFPNAKDVTEIEKLYPPRNLESFAQVTRFAPSPTGYLHIGHFFSALVDFCIAHSTNGIFYFRLEDTDKKREVDGAGKVALELLKKLDVYPDEGWLLEGEIGSYGPYRQSERLIIYHAYAKNLVEKGRAFPCFCRKAEGVEEIKKLREQRYKSQPSNEEYDPCRNLSLEQIEQKIAAGEKFALRLKTNGHDGDRVRFWDVQKGEIELQANAKDVVLVKENGIPPYAFAHAVDDHLMKTSLVVRGEEWLPSTPAHIEIFNALGFELPNYFHAPLICKISETGGRVKLSKRLHPEADMRFFFKDGYPALAIKEYVLSLINSGFERWREEHPLSPLSDFKLSPSDITAVTPIFDIIKLNDVSKSVISRMSAAEVYENVLEWAVEFDQNFASELKAKPEFCKQVFNIDRESPKPRKDIFKWSMIRDYFSYMFDQPSCEQLEERDKVLFGKFIESYLSSFNFPNTKDEWFEHVKQTAEKNGYALDNKEFKSNPEKFNGNLAKACEHLRIALTGRKNSPDLFELISILGESEVKNRLENAIKNRH